MLTPVVKTKGMAKLGFLKVASIMKPAPAGLNGAAVKARATVADTAPLFRSGIDILRVEDADGRTAGALHRTDVVDLMMRG